MFYLFKMVSKKFLLYISCFILCLEFALASQKHPDYNDNDFAEFEDFDEEFESKPIIGKSHDQSGSPARAQANSKPENNPQDNDDDDDFDNYEFEDDLDVGDKKPARQVEEEEIETVVEEEDNDEYTYFSDEEEFIGFDGETPNVKSAKHSEEPKITIAKVPLHLRSNWDSFYLEMLMLAGLIVYFINFIIGKNKNHRLAKTWFNAHKTVLENNFALVGDDGKPEVSSKGLQKESENVYVLWCSGRSNVQGMLVELRFIKRQDLIGVISQMIRPNSDQILIKVNMDEMDSFVFAFGCKKTVTKLSKEMTDISTYCPDKKTMEKYNFGSQTVVCSELIDVTAAVLGDAKVFAILSRFPGLLDYFHFSDQYSGPKQQDEGPVTKLPEVKKQLLFCFNFSGKGNPTLESVEELQPLLHLVLHLTDKLAKFRLPKEAKAKTEKNRQKVEEAFLKATHAARAEMAQAKREEKRRAERERMMELDDPEKQRKWEEREQRRQLKKRGPKMKQLKVKQM